MEWLIWGFAILFALFGLACVVMVALGLPGTWVLLGLALVIELVDGAVLGRGDPLAVSTFGWRLLAGSTTLALIGEGIEFASGAAGARLGGGTRRGMWGALLGGIAGAIAFTVALPMPVIGTLLGALVGTFLGAWIGERSVSPRRAHAATNRAAMAAVVGHLGGLLGKLIVAVVVWILLVRAALEI